MTVRYNGNLITISSSNKNKNLLVYSHPGDSIKFDFDISPLVKKIINGDLVIYLLNGRTITLVNFGLMALDNQASILSDPTQTYTPFSLFDSSYYYEDDGITPYVISRQISSPDNNTLPSGDQLPSSKDLFLGEGNVVKYSGVSDESMDVNNEVSPYIQDFIIKTLFSSFQKLENSTINYISNNRFRYSDPHNDIYPIKLLLINPKVIPQYGCKVELLEKDQIHMGYRDVIISIGGGKLPGNEYAYYMYKPEVINLTSENDKIWFDGYKQSDMITRWFTLQLPTPTVIIDKVTIYGLPGGVKVPKGLDPNLNIKQFGGSIEITIRGNAAGLVEIPIQYMLGFGGEEGWYSSVSINYEGVQTQTGDLVKGNISSFFEFKPVRNEDDISNYNKFNTFTFSNLRDPLIIWFSANDDVIKGGKGDYTYYGNAGNNKAYGGEANEIFHLGVGNNSFYAGLGNAVVDVDNPSRENSLYLSDAINKADVGSVYTVINNGKIYFGGKSNGKTFTTTATDFSHLYFNIGDNNQETERNNILTISSTKNLNTNINAYFGKGNHIVRLDNDPMIIEVKPVIGSVNAIFIHTKDVINGVFIKWDKEGDSYILGSLKNDTVIGSDSNVSIKFDGSGRGENTADYSNVTSNLTYNAATGLLIKEGNQENDVIKGIKNFLSGVSKSTLYGATHYRSKDGKIYNADINYFGGADSIEELNTLSYINLEKKNGNGVTIDLLNSIVIKHATKGIDKFSKIGNLQSSNNDDTFIISNDPVSRVLDGLEGFNTIDYSNLGAYTVFNIDMNNPGSVQKGDSGNYGIDTIRNFRYFIGSHLGAEFVLRDINNEYNVFVSEEDKKKFRFILECKTDETVNKVSYSNINGKSMILDLNLKFVTAAIRSGYDPDSNIVSIDKLININNFFLSINAKNIIYAYSTKVFEYILDGGASGDNTLSFEKCKDSLSIDFGAGDFSNIANINNLILTKNNDSIIMGYYFFAKNIDGLGGINKVDFSNITGPLNLVINLVNINFQVDIGSNKIVNFKHFQQIISTFENDVYFIKFDLKDIDKIKDKNIFIDGNIGNNTINFSETTDSINKTNGLLINLNGEYCLVKDDKGNEILKFINFTNIIGSQGNDTFILPKGTLLFNIDGGGGDKNAVSYQVYTEGIYINPEIFSKFKNIQKIIGTQGNDIIELDKNSSFNVDGYDGFNILSYSKNITFDSLTITISDISVGDLGLKSLIEVNKGNNITDKLNTIGYINLEDNIVKNGAEFFINNQGNTTLNKNGKVFLSGSQVESGKDPESKITYKEDLKDITLNLHVTTSQLVNGAWVSVTKGNNSSIDYLKNFSSITLSKKSTVNIFNNISSLPNIRNLIVDGREDSILSFEFYTANIRLDVKELTFNNNITINFKGFTSFKASGALNTQFIFLSAGDKNYTFNGLGSETTLSYENLSEDISINISKDNSIIDGIYNKVSINKGNTTDKAYNILNFVGSQGVTKIIVNSNFSRSMTFTGNVNKKNDNLIDYHNLLESNPITFEINKSQILVGRASGEYYDIIVNINRIIGSKNNTNFRFDNDVVSLNNFYEIDGAGGINTLNLVNIDYSIDYYLDGEGKINLNINNNKFAVVKNIHVLWGSSSKTNNFKLGNFFEGQYITAGSLQLYGSSNKSEDTLDLTDTNKGLFLDPLTGEIVETTSNKQLKLFTMLGISVIKLGDGNHQIDVSNRTSNVGWKQIIGGKGKNNVSFDKLVTSINYNLAEGVEGLSFKIINFTGVTGTKNNDIFYLKDDKLSGIRINGNGGSYNLLDYSKLTVDITVDLLNNTVTRGSIQDTVENITIFKTGSGSSKFIGVEKNIYQFIASEDSNSKNILDYSNVKSDLIFSFINSNVLKPDGYFDKFSNISEIIGGAGNTNIFLFALKNISQKINEIIIDGGKGENNVVNLAQLEKGIIYYIGDQYFEVNNNTTKLKVILKNIHNVIGSSYGDTFIFDDTINNMAINGGSNITESNSIIDFSRVTSSVNVNFIQNQILFGNNKNTFVNVNKFIGSKKGGDTFRGLNNYIKYDLTGGAGGNNTVIYDNCSVYITLAVKNNKIIINKSDTIIDNLTNIQNIVLTNLSDVLLLNNINDLEVLQTALQSIDGSFGDNKVLINFEIPQENHFIIDLSQGNIKLNQKVYNINFKNFRAWEFTKKSFNEYANYTFIAPKDLTSLRSIKFASPPNYYRDFYSTLDLKNISDNFFLVVTNNPTERSKGLEVNITSSKTNHTIFLHYVTKVILPEGKHFINYSTIIYKGMDASYILTVGTANPSNTEINYFIDFLSNEVGGIYIDRDGIKFSKEGTRYDILSGKSYYNVSIGKLVSKEYLTLCFEKDLSSSEERKPIVIYLKDYNIKDNSIILTNKKSRRNNNVYITVRDESVTSFKASTETFNLVFLSRNVDKLKLVLDSNEDNVNYYYLEFYSYHCAFSSIDVQYTTAGFVYDFSHMDANSGGGGIYANINCLGKEEFYAYTPGSTPLEKDKIYTLNRLYTINDLKDYIEDISIYHSSYEDYYKINITNKKLSKGISYPYVLISKNNDPYSFTLNIALNKMNTGTNLIDIVDSLITISEKGISIHDTTKAVGNYVLGSIDFRNDLNTLVRSDLVFTLDKNVFSPYVSFNINLEGVRSSKIRSITLPDPSTLTQYKELRCTLQLGEGLLRNNILINNTIAILDIKNDNTVADMQVINAGYNLAIFNIPLPAFKFNLAHTSWMDTSNLYVSSIVFQGDKNANFLKFLQKSFGKRTSSMPYLNLMDNKQTSQNYMGVVDLSNIYLGSKSDIPFRSNILTFRMADNDKGQGFSCTVNAEGGNNPVRLIEINNVSSMRIQRTEMNFITKAQISLSSESFKLHGTTLFSFGEMRKMNLPANKDYQIFTRLDSFIPNHKHWDGRDLEETYTNGLITTSSLDFPQWTFDATKNNQIIFSKINSSVEGFNSYVSQAISKDAYLNIDGLNPNTPFVIDIRFRLEYKLSLTLNYSAQPEENVVVRIFRGANTGNYNQALTFTNDYEYNDVNFKYYGTVSSKFKFINILALNYTIKSFENRDKRFDDIPLPSSEKGSLDCIELNSGIYSFSGVDIGSLDYQNNQFHGRSAIITFMKNPRSNISNTKLHTFFVTDSVMVRDAEGYSYNSGNRDSEPWLNALVNKVSQKAVIYSGVTKFIISGNKSKIPVKDLMIDSIPLRVFLDYRQFDSSSENSYTAIFQRDVFKGDRNNPKDVNNYLGDAVSFNADTLAKRFTGGIAYDSFVFFNGKNAGLSYNATTFLVKDMCFSTKVSWQTEHDQGLIYGKGCKACNIVFGSDLAKPEFLERNKQYPIFLDFRDKGTKVTVVLPTQTGGEVGTYKYHVILNSSNTHAEISIKLRDFETHAFYNMYSIRVKVDKYNKHGGIKIQYTKSPAQHYEFINDNCKNLFDLTLEGNDSKIDLDKIKDSTTRSNYITWENQQEYLNSLDKVSAKDDYWLLVDKYIEESFNVKSINNDNNITEDSYHYTVNKSLPTDDDILLEEEDYFIEDDNTNTNHNSIFETSFNEDSWNLYPEKEVDNNISDKEFELSEENLEDNNEEITNHIAQYDSIEKNETESSQESTIAFKESINLSNLFEKVKSISESIDNTTLVEEYGLNYLTVEELNHTYQQDETNSMSYTIDGCTNIASNCGNDYTIETTTQENNKNKTNH